MFQYSFVCLSLLNDDPCSPSIKSNDYWQKNLVPEGHQYIYFTFSELINKQQQHKAKAVTAQIWKIYYRPTTQKQYVEPTKSMGPDKHTM